MASFDRFPIARVGARVGAAVDPDVWPGTIPAVRQLLGSGLSLGRATVLVGENGAGTSTLVEGIAMAFGLSPEGGSPNTMRETRPSESPLHQHLQLVRNAGASRFGYFLRAETMHGRTPPWSRTRAAAPARPTSHSMSCPTVSLFSP